MYKRDVDELDPNHENRKLRKLLYVFKGFFKTLDERLSVDNSHVHSIAEEGGGTIEFVGINSIVAQFNSASDDLDHEIERINGVRSKRRRGKFLKAVKR
ncbi:hypothetical protein [Psittacicella hinzii]|nr:hypothetical protein [Psittacicella hinzii]